MKINCVACGKELLDRSTVAISHTISPGNALCTECGQRESVDAAWALGVRIGLLRAEEAQKVIEKDTYSPILDQGMGSFQINRLARNRH